MSRIILGCFVLKKETTFEIVFANRGALCFLVIVALFVSCILRISVIINSGYTSAQTTQSSYRINVAKIRSSIFDCNMIPLTNNTFKTMAVVSPTPQGVTDIHKILSGTKLDAVLSTLREGKAAVCEVKKKVESSGIAYTNVYTTENILAEHLIGYTDSVGKGVCGIEKAYDNVLYKNEYVSAVFTVSAGGDILNGIKPYFDGDLSLINDGVVTTLDINIQNIANIAANKIKKGAVIISDAKTNKIRAMVSKPSFDIKNLSVSLEDENLPFLNRCLSAFNVGAVFKPCVAAAALERGKASYVCNCTGVTHIIDRNFKCHKNDGHGFVNLKSAIAYSCNSYFYNLGINLGADEIYRMASVLNFGTKLKLCENIFCAKGNLPKINDLSNDAFLANLSIGQGDLMLSPVSMLTLYSAIVNDGYYYVPSVIKGTVKNGNLSKYDIGQRTRAFSKETANALKEYLFEVINGGTGSLANPKSVSAIGKTATAQTGKYYDSGEEITNSWFCGAFPKENPKYVVIVMSDGKNEISCNTVFAEIADKITEIS